MIIQTFDTEPWKGLALLELALTPDEMDTLRTIAVEATTDWEAGRQGGGYFKLNLQDWMYEAYSVNLRTIRSRLLSAISRHLKLKDGRQLQKANDFWLLYYPSGSRVHWHTDAAPFGAKHWRVNVCVEAPESGGLFMIEQPAKNKVDIPLSVGEGVLFSPSELPHAVSTIMAGHRLMVSVGAVVSDE